ncbi:MAG TPA: hypothetical protein DDW31_04680 [candidate division Zixibacteria bacterium]|jgi:putative IMPACT (imprinted ancient) family translation regulator|nr:hypothetical protein [candidate division Zixibacteria bacterium]
MAIELINPFAVDRGSRYAAASFPVGSEAEFEQGMKELLRPKRFRDADHHIAAYRIMNSDGSLSEYKNDGYRSPSKETGAGVMVLEIMRQKNVMNRCVVVTRWYGGVHLGADRFKHVREAAKAVLDRV